MKIRFGEMTRGNGKIFIKVSWDEGKGTLQAKAHVISKDGSELPVVLIPVDQCSCVAVLAIFEIGQRLNVTLVNEREMIVATGTRQISPLSARVHSQMNTLRRNQSAEAIRNLDEKTQQDIGLSVSFDRFVYQYVDSDDILHGFARIVCHRGELTHKNLTLKFFDQNGGAIHGHEWIWLGTSSSELFGGNLYQEHVISFSMQLPASALTLACLASVNTPSGTFTQLMCIQAHELGAMRQGWYDFINGNQPFATYDEWFRRCQRITCLEEESQREASFEIEPTFSIVVPLYETPITFLEEMAHSALGQTYGKLELILVNASPHNEMLSAAVKALADKDSRVKPITLEGNLGIVGNTYVGVDAATGDFVSFFDHDDVLEPDLLYRYVEGINRHPTTDLLYCDEDKLCGDSFQDPYLKPDWNIDHVMSNNYVCHLLTIRRSIMDELPREGLEAYEGAQDHFLTLFAAERARNIYHARKVLYHWRMHEQSAAANPDSKAYTEAAGVRAIQSHLDRMKIEATVRTSDGLPNCYHVDYALHDNPLVSIIIPNKDMPKLLDRCVTSILEKSTYGNYEIVIVENNSTKDETFSLYEELKKRDNRIRVIGHEANDFFNFSRTINHGVKEAHGDYLLLLDNDTEVQTPDWIQKMAGPLQRSDVGGVGVKLLYPDGLIQHCGILVHKRDARCHAQELLPANTMHHFALPQLMRDCSAVSASCMMVRKETFDAVGGFDEQLAVDFSDVDFCLRLRAKGLLIMYEPEVVLTHYGSMTRGNDNKESQDEDWTIARGIMMQRYPSFFVDGDPYCNPNLASSAYYQLQP